MAQAGWRAAAWPGRSHRARREHGGAAAIGQGSGEVHSLSNDALPGTRQARWRSPKLTMAVMWHEGSGDKAGGGGWRQRRERGACRRR
jgi:hypothetical protein